MLFQYIIDRLGEAGIYHASVIRKPDDSIEFVGTRNGKEVRLFLSVPWSQAIKEDYQSALTQEFDYMINEYILSVESD